MPVVFLIIFVLLFMTLKDYMEAGVVMLSVPFALIGGMYMIYILGYNFSVAVWLDLLLYTELQLKQVLLWLFTCTKLLIKGLEIIKTVKEVLLPRLIFMKRQ